MTIYLSTYAILITALAVSLHFDNRYWQKRTQALERDVSDAKVVIAKAIKVMEKMGVDWANVIRKEGKH